MLSSQAEILLVKGLKVLAVVICGLLRLLLQTTLLLPTVVTVLSALYMRITVGPYVHHLCNGFALRDQLLNTNSDLTLLLVKLLLGHVGRTVDEAAKNQRAMRRKLNQFVRKTNDADTREDDEEQPTQNTEEGDETDDDGYFNR